MTHCPPIYEYWDCEGRAVRVRKDTGYCEEYRNGAWGRDSSQLHPGHRGHDISSDYTPILEHEDLAQVLVQCDRLDERAQGVGS